MLAIDEATKVLIDQAIKDPDAKLVLRNWPYIALVRQYISDTYGKAKLKTIKQPITFDDCKSLIKGSRSSTIRLSSYYVDGALDFLSELLCGKMVAVSIPEATSAGQAKKDSSEASDKLEKGEEVTNEPQKQPPRKSSSQD
jgi:hypothetical protein